MGLGVTSWSTLGASSGAGGGGGAAAHCFTRRTSSSRICPRGPLPLFAGDVSSVGPGSVWPGTRFAMIRPSHPSAGHGPRHVTFARPRPSKPASVSTTSPQRGHSPRTRIGRAMTHGPIAGAPVDHEQAPRFGRLESRCLRPNRPGFESQTATSRPIWSNTPKRATGSRSVSRTHELAETAPSSTPSTPESPDAAPRHSAASTHRGSPASWATERGVGDRGAVPERPRRLRRRRVR